MEGLYNKMTNTGKTKDKEKNLNDIVKVYLNTIISSKTSSIPELEVRFGTARGMRPITRIDQDNVVKRLISAGFHISDAQYMLRMNPEYIEQKTGLIKESNVRVELLGLQDISEYCKNDNIDSVVTPNFMKKYRMRDDEGRFEVVDVPDFNFRVAISEEINILPSSRLARNIVDTWADNKKSFRYIQRHTLRSNDFPMVRVDLSIVKESKRKGRDTVRNYKFIDSNIINGSERYEIEIEVEPKMVGYGTLYETSEAVVAELRRIIKLVLSGIQNTNYPISMNEQKSTLSTYMNLIHGNKYQEERIYPRHFIGPSSYTLQVVNIAPLNENAEIPNIRNNYTVTDKADGERKLLYISSSGRLYLIDTNMNVQFTGAITTKQDTFNSIFDGEHILHNKNGEYINLYAAFDIYYDGGQDVRNLPFIPKDEDINVTARLPILIRTIKRAELRGIQKNSITPIIVKAKTFMATSKSQSIFQCCSTILQRVNEGLFEYNTDGLIFTPSYFGVGADKENTQGPNKKITWSHSFKWKPPQFNTIDFLVTTIKETNGLDKIGNIFQNGTDTSAVSQITQYKTLILRVGFDESMHGYINPCKAIYDGDLPKPGDIDNDAGYKPMQFFPTNPVDDNAGICNLVLGASSSGNKVMFAENGDVVEDNMIVEFSYESTKEQGWRWKPLRVRYDKTADFRSGGRNFGNAYHVANSNWHSLHNPITENMLATGNNIPDELGDDDVYYNRVSGNTMTRGLRDFHNLFVKSSLITATTRRGDNLIDLAVGKGGDWPKWIHAKLKFVFGIDVSRDNIENRLDGACARTLNYRKKFRVMPDALFVTGNSSVNIRNGDAIFTDKGKQIVKAIFGQGTKDVKILGNGVYKQFGIGKDGFDVCSIQFAIHYMFETQNTLNNFLRNVSETTKVGGYFIGTSYDGEQVFKLLEKKNPNESIAIFEGNKRIWEVTKRYDNKEFLSDSSSVGYAIDVYQESINKTFREYLVNYDYLDRIMENYGFSRLTRTEASELGLPATSGSFRQLYGQLQDEVSRNPRTVNEYGKSLQMSVGERKVSFLNKYFVYRKTHDVNAETVANSLLGQTIAEERLEHQETADAIQAVENIVDQQKKVKKTKRRLILKTSEV